MTYTHQIKNGVRIELTAEEIAQREAEAQAILASKPSEFDIAIDFLRAKRNKLLADTDYLALSDNTMSEAMTTYRQSLRDITEGLTTVADVEAVTFPTKPE